jgi:hypothetical protein
MNGTAGHAAPVAVVAAPFGHIVVFQLQYGRRGRLDLVFRVVMFVINGSCPSSGGGARRRVNCVTS